MRYTIAVDFDGVLHSYTSPWVDEHTISDPPVQGAMDWLTQMAKDFDIVVHTTRGRTQQGAAAVLQYLALNGFQGPLTVTAQKPPALVYIDDRAWRFLGPGSFPDRQQVMQARPWNKVLSKRPIIHIFDKWLADNNIVLMPHQKRFAEEILKLNMHPFQHLASGLTFTLQTVDWFMRENL